MNVTNACNLSCSYCYEKDKDSRMMTPAEAVAILDAVYRRPASGDFMVNIFGGEPLLAWETIAALAGHIRAEGYQAKLGITTNLTLLTEAMIDAIEEYEIALLVSLDGVKEVHDRGRSGSYDIVVGNLKRLLKRRLHYLVQVRMTVTPDGVDRLFDGVKSLVDLGVDNVAPCLVTDQEWSAAQLDELKSQAGQLYDWFLAIAGDPDNKRNIAVKLVDDYMLAVLSPVLIERQMCGIGTKRWCTVGPGGDILPCHQQHTNLTVYAAQRIGNLFGEVDEAKVTDAARPRRLKEECRSCDGVNVCRGGCPSENLLQRGDFFTPTAAHCATVKVLTKVAHARQQAVMAAGNLRPRLLNLLKTNLRLKAYFDEVVARTDIADFDFPVILAAFAQRLAENKGLILPAFAEYYRVSLRPLEMLLGGMPSADTGQ